MTTTTIPPEDLSRLEESVRAQMLNGRWQEALIEIRATASLYGMSSDELARLVAREALQQGHVKPLIQLEAAD